MGINLNSDTIQVLFQDFAPGGGGGGGQMLSAQILGGGASIKNQHSACISTPI